MFDYFIEKVKTPNGIDLSEFHANQLIPIVNNGLPKEGDTANIDLYVSPEARSLLSKYFTENVDKLSKTVLYKLPVVLQRLQLKSI